MILKILPQQKILVLLNLNFYNNIGDPIIKMMISSSAEIKYPIVMVVGLLETNHVKQGISELCVRVVIYMALEMAIGILLINSTIVLIVLILQGISLYLLGSQSGLY